MAFLYSAIGDNTIENREHLEKLGYTMSMVTMDKSLLLKTQTNGKYYETNKDDWSEAIVNCIGNPQLFQAVSAMSDDSDYMQFFVSKGWRDAYDDPIPDKWVLCTSNTLEEFGNVNNSPNSYSIPIFGWIKATISELQAHFQRV